MHDGQDLAQALIDVAREINTTHDVDATLDAIVRTARGSLPGVDHVGISLLRQDGTIETVSGTDQLVWGLDSVQYSLREGPCYDAVVTGPVCVAGDLRHDGRWPNYAARAVERGVKSQMGLRLFLEEETFGALNLYSTSRDVLTPDVQHVAELFSAHAALALGRARQVEGLNTALQTRKVIGQALGIVMERYQLDEDRAFQFLIRVSSQSNAKLRDIAQELVDQANERARTERSL